MMRQSHKTGITRVEEATHQTSQHNNRKKPSVWLVSGSGDASFPSIRGETMGCALGCWASFLFHGVCIHPVCFGNARPHHPTLPLDTLRQNEGFGQRWERQRQPTSTGMSFLCNASVKGAFSFLPHTYMQTSLFCAH